MRRGWLTSGLAIGSDSTHLMASVRNELADTLASEGPSAGGSHEINGGKSLPGFSPKSLRAKNAS